MNDENDVRDLLQIVTPHPPESIDVTAVRQGAHRRTTRRTLLLGGVAVGVTGGAVGLGRALTGPMTTPVTSPPASPAPLMQWLRLPDMPLTGRRDPLVVWTGSEALVLGGVGSEFVGGSLASGFPDLRDGAAFNPETVTWRPIADAPVGLGMRGYGPSVLAGTTLVVGPQGGEGWLAYDINDDRWRELPAPPYDVLQPTFAAADTAGLVYALDVFTNEGDDNAPVQVLNLADDSWSALPTNTIDPQIDTRTLVMTDVGLVVMGETTAPLISGRGPEAVRADLWDGSAWTRFPDSDVRGRHWVWTGERIIATSRSRLGRRAYPGLRIGALDPHTGEWWPLPWSARITRGLLTGGWSTANGTRALSDGFLYNDADRSSVPIPRPSSTNSDATAVIGANYLMTFGGYTLPPGTSESRGGTQIEPSSEVWSMRIS